MTEEAPGTVGAPVGDRSSAAPHGSWPPPHADAYRRGVRRAPFLVRLVLVLSAPALLALVPPAPPAAASARPAHEPARIGLAPSAVPVVTVSPDPERDLYAGTGGLVVPARDWRGSSDGRRQSASCLDCEWRITVLCSKADFAAGRCRSIHLGCPVGTTAVRVWLLRPGADWAAVGEACQGPRKPVTVGDVGRKVRDRAEKALPALRPAAQPADGALIGVPVVLRVGQPAGGIRGADLSVLGLDVRLDSRVRWQWTYGDGTSVWTSLPGGAYPDMSLTHTYRHAGSRTVGVLAVWRGQYTVEGLGPFVVPGPLLTQRRSLRIVVRVAHARLVG